MAYLTSIAARTVFTQSVVQPSDVVLVEGPEPIGVVVASVADSMGANVIQNRGEYLIL
jgi:L-iditol 2-dehydrogenase